MTELQQQRVGTWVFGSALLLFYGTVYFFSPEVIPDFKYRMLGVISGLLVGLLSFLITGDIVVTVDATLSGGAKGGIKAAGGFGVGLLVVWWWSTGLTPYKSESQVREALQQAIASNGAQAVDVNKVTAVAVSRQVQELATKLADSDPAKYQSLKLLRAGKTIPVETFSTAVSTVQESAPQANVRGLSALFSEGIGPFKLGMQFTTVNQLLPQPYGVSNWHDLPVASEYKHADVHYFWLPLSNLRQMSAFYDALTPFHACWGGESYATFLFSEGKLSRISTRLYPDCSQRVDLLRQFADKYAIRPFDPNSPLAFQVTLPATTVAGYISRDAASLEIFANESPQLEPTDWPPSN